MSGPMQDKVVIYGGGIAGGVLAHRLSRQVRVTLVDPLDYFEIPMAAPRHMVRPGGAGRAIIPFADSLPEVEHVRGKLVELTPDGGVVEDTQGNRHLVSGDISVLATGSRFANELVRPQSGTATDRISFYARIADRITAAKRVLVVGGGPIGVEVCGEISQHYPGKTITLVEAGPRLLAGTSEKAAAHAAAVLESRGVTIIVNDRLEGSERSADDVFAGAGGALTSSGRRISYDLILWCVGGRPNTGYMQAHFAGVLNDRGRIKVTEDLRVIGYPMLFAIGDINDVPENKMAAHIKGQVAITEANIRLLAAGGAPERLKAYRPQTGNPLMAVTFGSEEGMVQLPRPAGLIRAGWFSRKVKAREMLVPKYRKILGV